MAQKKVYYHRNKKGEWKPCSSKDRCPFKEHKLKDNPDYDLYSGNAYQRNAVELNRFEEKLRNAEKNPMNFSLDEKSYVMRDLSNYFQSNPSMKKKMFEGTMRASVFGDKRAVTFDIKRLNMATGIPPRRITGWNLTVRDRETQEILDEVEMPVVSEYEAKYLKKNIVSSVLNTMRKIYSDQYEADQKALQYLKRFFNVMSSIETEDKGPIGATGIGFSFFNDSTKTEIIVKADYRETTFRAEHLKEMLESPQYVYEIPEVVMIMQDSNPSYNDASWTINFTNGQWVLIKVDKNGKTEVEKDIYEAEDLAKSIYDFGVKSMGYNKEEANKAYNYTYSLYDNVNNLIAEAHSRKIEFMQNEVNNSTDKKFRELYYDAIGLPDPDIEARSEKRLSGFLGKIFG